jgi:hypothetical protein
VFVTNHKHDKKTGEMREAVEIFQFNQDKKKMDVHSIATLVSVVCTPD